MDLIKLDFSESELLDITQYAKDVIQTPQRYITGPVFSDFESKMLEPLDVNDPTLPVFGDEFIFSHDLNSKHWNDHSLDHGLFNNLDTISYPPMKTLIPLFRQIEDNLNKKFIKPRGTLLYPKGGYLSWHTNSYTPGTRVYATYSPQENSSYFKYVDRWTSDTPTIITDWDSKGWTIRAFTPSNLPSELMWHCVHAPHAPRISFGFMFN